MKKLITLIVAIAIVGLAFLALRDGTESTAITTPSPTPTPTTPSPTPTPNGSTTTTNSLIHVSSPTANSVVKSPLEISGEARGNWYFEASFPVRILDANGKELGAVPAEAQGEWMTTEFVPFKVSLKFSTSTTDTGTLVLEKDNPSGLPQNAQEIRIPIRFR